MNKTRTELLPLARGLEAIGDPWSFLILQEAFFGVRRFEEFQRNLGIARKTLADRLNRLHAHGLLKRTVYEAHPPRHEYRLTPASLDTYPYALCLMRWGDKWLSAPDGPPVLLYHKSCRHRLRPLAVCAACDTEILAEHVSISLSTTTVPVTRSGTQVRYSSRPGLYTAGRPSSISRTVATIGDRWGFFVLWLSLAGITRFEHFHHILGIARTVLASRLERMVELGLIERRLYQERPKRYDYCPTDKGHSLCPVLLAMFDWGLRWQGATAARAQVRHKSCGGRLQVNVVCGHCREVVKPRDVEIGASRRASRSD